MEKTQDSEQRANHQSETSNSDLESRHQYELPFSVQMCSVFNLLQNLWPNEFMHLYIVSNQKFSQNS